MKAFADEKLDVAIMMFPLFYSVENTGGKGENAGYMHFLLCPAVFSKASIFRVVKSRDCVVRSSKLLCAMKIIPMASILSFVHEGPTWLSGKVFDS